MSPVLVTTGDTLGVPPARPLSDNLAPREELVRVRAGAWQMLLPLRFVEQVLGAALPAVSAGDAPPLVSVRGSLVPVLFADALLGAETVELRAEDQMVLLRHDGRRALLWIDAVEEVVEFAPVPPPAGEGRPFVAAFSGPERPLAVLDIPRLLELAA